MFYRPDFVNITVASAGAFMMSQSEIVTYKGFRKLVFAVAATILYDFIYLFIMNNTGEAVDA